MDIKRLSRQTCRLTDPPGVVSWASVAGRLERQGPLGGSIDITDDDSFFGKKTWEQGEAEMQALALRRALRKGGLTPQDVDCIFAGDLLNQYGACSTMGESLSLAAMAVAGGFARIAAAQTSSHFCTAERQYRAPVPYGSQRAPTAQWTATAAGCCVVGVQSAGPYITHTTRGRIVDLGITDAANMGAAMAPAAHDTLTALFRDTATTPRDYDLIVTGDLGYLGHALLTELFRRDGVELGDNCTDCGLLLYDRVKQDMHAGGSGCGCSAAVLNGYLLHGLRTGRWQRLVFAPTGALLSPTSSFQGESVPGICHAVVLSHTKEAV